MKLKHLIFFSIVILLSSCKSKDNSTEVSIILDEASVTAFAMQLEQSVVNGNPDFFNNAFDKSYLKTLIRDNSIVNSSLDAEFGQIFFENNFHLGDEAVNSIENGGDFKFVRYYLNEEDSSHHIVLRSYNDFTLNFYDCIVDTLGGQAVIKDAFIYNTGCNFSDNIRENILLNVLYKTNPEGITSMLSEIRSLNEKNKNKDAQELLTTHARALGDLNCYWQLYIANLYKICPKKKFIDSLNTLESKGVDIRLILLHRLLFNLNEGLTVANNETINKLIDYTGDDPIYLLIFGKTNYYAKNYVDALNCYETASQYLPPLWDLWYGKLECYHVLHDEESFNSCLTSGGNYYGMTEEELLNLKNKSFKEQSELRADFLPKE